MIRRLAVIAVAAAGIGFAMPASADDVGVAVGPIGATVGTGHGDAYRDHDRDIVRERDHRDRDDTVVIQKGHERDRDIDHDRKTVIIEHQ